MAARKKARPTRTNTAGRKLLAGLEQLHRAYTTGDFSKLTVRTVEIPGPNEYRARDVKALRDALGVSQGIFAQLVAVSPELVAHWEHGLRKPAPVVCRLLDKIKENPSGYLAAHVQRKIA